MTDHGWDEGYSLLEANLRDTDKTPAMKALRGATLRAAMDHLTDEQWGVVVQQALRSESGWFPVLGELEAYAAALPPTGSVMFVPTEDGRVRRVITEATPAPALTDETRTPEERREDAKRLLDQVVAAVTEREKHLPPTPVVTQPEPAALVVLSDERLDELRRQARAIAEQPEPTTVEGGV